MSARPRRWCFGEKGTHGRSASSTHCRCRLRKSDRCSVVGTERKLFPQSCGGPKLIYREPRPHDPWLADRLLNSPFRLTRRSLTIRAHFLQRVVSNPSWKHGPLAVELYAPFDL